MTFDQWWEKRSQRLAEQGFSYEEIEMAYEAAKIAYQQGLAGVPMDDSIIYALEGVK